MDRRHHNRYELKASATFRWKDAEGRRCFGRGHLRDISEKGVFVATDTQPPVGATVRFDVLFDSFRDGSTVMIHTKSNVIRVESANQTQPHHGFAAATRTLKIRNHMMNVGEDRQAGREARSVSTALSSEQGLWALGNKFEKTGPVRETEVPNSRVRWPSGERRRNSRRPSRPSEYLSAEK